MELAFRAIEMYRVQIGNISLIVRLNDDTIPCWVALGVVSSPILFSNLVFFSHTLSGSRSVSAILDAIASKAG